MTLPHHLADAKSQIETLRYDLRRRALERGHRTSMRFGRNSLRKLHHTGDEYVEHVQGAQADVRLIARREVRGRLRFHNV